MGPDAPGQYFIARLRDGDVAVITGQLGAVNLNERIAGIKQGLAKYPGIKIVETQGTDDDLAKGVSVVKPSR